MCFHMCAFYKPTSESVYSCNVISVLSVSVSQLEIFSVLKKTQICSCVFELSLGVKLNSKHFPTHQPQLDPIAFPRATQIYNFLKEPCRKTSSSQFAVLKWSLNLVYGQLDQLVGQPVPSLNSRSAENTKTISYFSRESSMDSGILFLPFKQETVTITTYCMKYRTGNLVGTQLHYHNRSTFHIAHVWY